jgi:hypothetical protein
LLNAIESLTADMDEPDMPPVTHNDHEYGLVAFCMNNAMTALEDAKNLPNKFKQEGNAKFWVVKHFFQENRKRLLFVLREQDIQGYVHRVETAIAGLGIAIHAASLARTNDACVPTVVKCKTATHVERLTLVIRYAENKKAIADLTGQLVKTSEKLEKSYKESRDKKEPTTVHLVVTSATRHSRASRAIPWLPSRRKRHSQAVVASPIEVSSQPAVIHKQPRVNTPPIQEQHLVVGGAVSPEPSHDQIEHASEICLEAISHIMPPFSNIAYEIPPLGRQVNDISITCEDGSEAFIPAGSFHEDSHEGIEDAEASSALVKATDKDVIPHSNAEELLDFLAKRHVPDRSPSPDGTTSTKSVKIGSVFDFKFVYLNNEHASESVKSDSSILRFLCVHRFLLNDRLPEIVARRPCDEFPQCGHTKIDQLDGGVSARELFASDMGYIMLAPYVEGREPQHIRPYKEFDAFIYEECTEPCSHTRVEETEKENIGVHCMIPLHLFALVGTSPEYSDTDENLSISDEARSNKAYVGDEDYTSYERGSEDGEDDDDIMGVGPFFSVPCLFCRKAALRPTAEGVKTSNSVVSYGCHTYGYRCARCEKISWITGARQAGFEDEWSQNDEERLTATNYLTNTAAQMTLPFLKRFFG